MSNKGLKRLLVQNYGKKCMYCGKHIDLKKCEYHHIKPKSAGGEATEQNGALVHKECHKQIHKYKYGTPEYYKTIIDILNNKINWKKY